MGIWLQPLLGIPHLMMLIVFLFNCKVIVKVKFGLPFPWNSFFNTFFAELKAPIISYYSTAVIASNHQATPGQKPLFTKPIVKSCIKALLLLAKTGSRG